MRVLMTTDTVGGVWNYSKELTEGLLRRGCCVTLVSMGRAPSAGQMSWANQAKGSWPRAFDYLPTEFKLEWMQDGLDCFELSRGYVEDRARACGADVLHSNQFCYGALDVAMPKIVVGHSDVRSWWGACRGGVPECSAWSEAYRRTVTQGLREADAVVAPTRWMAEQLRTHYDFAKPVQVIANGRGDVPAEDAAEADAPRRMQAITCGRLWDEGKNLRLVRGVDAGMPILVAGETEFEAGCEVPEPVEFLGALGDAELQAQFRSSALYLVTSQYEPFGLAAVEAALAGCALVVNDIASLREVWGDAAVYFERNSAESLSSVLQSLGRDEERVRRMAKAAESRARERYSAERMTDEYLARYGELLDGELAVMSRRFRVAMLTHSLRSDWNNGNAHFLRGLARAMTRLGHEFLCLEAETGWSIENLRTERERGGSSLREFGRVYPDIPVRTYADEVGLERELDGAEVVIVHEWHTASTIDAVLRIRERLGFKALFHDTHHRASSSPEQIRLLQVERFDGVLAFGEALRTIYRERFGMEWVWTLHEAADTSVFHPRESAKTDDVVWVGNWGNGERSVEIGTYLLEPAMRSPGRRFTIYGVRYPEEGVAALKSAGVRYCGYLPNLSAPGAYAAARLTVHVPRQQYSQAMAGIPTIRVFEALASGIPLVSAPWEDTEGLFREGDFVMAHDGEQMTAAIERLLASPQEAARQAARGLETVLARHTCDHRAAQLTGILEEVLS